jgi:hypothetical protein
VLSAIFDAEPDGNALYFHNSTGPNDLIPLSAVKFRAAIDASVAKDSTASRGA